MITSMSCVKAGAPLFEYTERSSPCCLDVMLWPYVGKPRHVVAALRNPFVSRSVEIRSPLLSSATERKVRAVL